MGIILRWKRDLELYCPLCREQLIKDGREVKDSLHDVREDITSEVVFSATLTCPEHNKISKITVEFGDNKIEFGKSS